jgi:DNA polymerase III epsilon subunit-like protein
MDKTIRVIDGVTYPLINGKTKPILINVAGKNFGTFDNVFLKKLPWWQKLIIAKQRIMDPAMLFLDWKTDEELPSLKICTSRAGIDGDVAHDALEDAYDVVSVLRKFY